MTLAHHLLAYRWWLLAVGLLAFGSARTFDRQLVFDRKIERLFPDDSPAAAAQADIKRLFGGNEIAVLTYAGANLFNEDGSGLRLLEETSAQVVAVPGVKSILSLSKVSRALARMNPGAMFAQKPAESGTAILGDDPVAVAFRDMFAGYTHSPDGQYAAIVVILDPDRDRSESSIPTIARLRQIADAMPAAQQPTSLVGEPVLVDEGFTMVQADGNRLGTVTLALLSLVMLVMFRSIRWALIQVAIICWSTVCTRAFLAAVGMQLTLVSSMLSAVITVIAVASVIHITVAEQSAHRRGCSPVAATREALQRVLLPIFWACLTDAVGFAALSVSSVGPVREFGLMMAAGALMVLIAIVLLVPALASMSLGGAFGPAQIPTARGPGRWIRHGFYGGYRWLGRHTPVVLAVLLVASLITGIGIRRLEIETNFIRNFRSDHRLAIDYQIVESHLGGAGVWDILLPAPPVLSAEYLASVDALETRLRDLGDDDTAGLRKVLSIADADQAARKNALLAFLPPGVRLAGMHTAMPHFVDALLAPGNTPREGSVVRVMLRSNEQVSAKVKQQLIDDVHDIVGQHTATDTWARTLGDSSDRIKPQVTGYYVLLTGLVAGLVGDQWFCFAIASAGVFVMLWIVAGSLRIAACAILPNVLPILGVLAGLGLASVPVNLGTAMIAAVSIGISIDGSIHFLVAFRRNRRRHDVPTSIARVYPTVGIAVVMATLALVIGFSTLVTSPFIPTATFGFLVSLSLVASTLANLTLLPWALEWTTRSSVSKKSSEGLANE